MANFRKSLKGHSSTILWHQADRTLFGSSTPEEREGSLGGPDMTTGRGIEAGVGLILYRTHVKILFLQIEKARTSGELFVLSQYTKGRPFGRPFHIIQGMICKPNSVSRLLSGWQSFIWSPNRFGVQAFHPAVLRRAAHGLHELAPCEVYPAPGVTAGAVGSYSTFSPLSASRRTVCFLWHWLPPTLSGIFPLGSTMLVGVRTFLPPVPKARVGDCPIIHYLLQDTKQLVYI